MFLQASGKAEKCIKVGTVLASAMIYVYNCVVHARASNCASNWSVALFRQWVKSRLSFHHGIAIMF